MKQKAYNYILIGFIAVILFYAVFMTYNDIRKNLPKRKESFNQATLKICLFKASWCHHCTSYLKSQTYNDVFLNNQIDGVEFATIDADSNKTMLNKYEINAFPTIVAIDSKGNLIDTFSGDRYNKDALMKFVKDNSLKA
jgi:thiol-disulfide isomerase/thioredoxin